MATLYTIDFTDPGKPTFSVSAYKTNGPASPTNPALDANATAANTSLLLYGKGSPSYGEKLQENLVHMLENFSGETAPVYPTRGQIWQDTRKTDGVTPDNILKVYSGTDWISVNKILASTVAPSPASTGQLWYDTDISDDSGQFTVSQLKVWNGGSWDSIASNYVLKTGGTMSGFLTLNADPTNLLHAATKNYVDTVSGSIGTHAADTTLHLSSDQNTFLDALNLPTLTAAEVNYMIGVTSNVQTQFNGKVSISGDTMTGYLTLNANPVNPFHASTKQYVDVTVAAATGDGVLDSVTFNADTWTLTQTTSAPASGVFITPLIHEHTVYPYNGLEDSISLWNQYDNSSIAAVDTALDTFTVSGDVRITFPEGFQFEVTGSTGNDQTWTVDTGGSTYDVITNTTTIPVAEDVTSAVADGTIVFVGGFGITLAQAIRELDILKAPVTNPVLLETTTLNIERPILSVVTGASGSYSIAGDHTTTFINTFVFDVVDSGAAEVTDITAVADVAGSLAGTYFTIDTPSAAYYVWYKVASVGADPMPGGRLSLGYIDLITNATADAVAASTQILLDDHWAFTATVSTSTITVTNVAPGIAPDATAGTSGFTILVTTQGTDGHNGTYTTASSSFGGGNTTIVITGTVPVATVGAGKVQWPQQPTARNHAVTKEYVDSENEIQRAIQTGAATTVPAYIVGSHRLFITVNGQKWYLTDGYTEVGTVGTLSTTISWVTTPSGSDRVEFLVF